MDGYRDDGKRNIISITCRTKAEVLDKIRSYWNQKENPTPVEEEKVEITFSQWADTWYADYQTEVQPSTYANYRYTLTRLKQHFGSTLLPEIKPLDINRFYDLIKAEYRQLVFAFFSILFILLRISNKPPTNDCIVKRQYRLRRCLR